MCEYLYEWGVQQHLLYPGPGERSKGQTSLNFKCKVNFKDFYTKTCVCVLTNKRYKAYQIGFLFCRLGHAPGMGLECAGGQKFISYDHGHVANKIGDDK